jgi:uncharacterized membrane protein
LSFIVKNFLRGLVVVVPVAVTVWVLWLGFVSLDRLLPLPIPGLGVLVVAAIVVVVGFLASNIVTRRVFHLVERLFSRAPIVKIVYSSIRDLTEAFAGDRRRFNQPVLVRLTADGGISAVGFVTRENAAAIGGGDRVVVYFPQSYNFAGQLLLVERANVEPLPLDSAQAIALVISGGVSGAERGAGAPAARPPGTDSSDRE